MSIITSPCLCHRHDSLGFLYFTHSSRHPSASIKLMFNLADRSTPKQTGCSNLAVTNQCHRISSVFCSRSLVRFVMQYTNTCSPPPPSLFSPHHARSWRLISNRARIRSVFSVSVTKYTMRSAVCDSTTSPLNSSVWKSYSIHYLNCHITCAPSFDLFPVLIVHRWPKWSNIYPSIDPQAPTTIEPLCTDGRWGVLLGGCI